MCIQGKFLECLQDNTEGTVMANRKWSSEWRQEGGCRDTQPRFTREMKISHSGLQQESLGSHQALTLAGMRARSQGKDAEDRGRMDFKLWSRKKNKRMKEREQYAHFKKKKPKHVSFQALTNSNTNSFFRGNSFWGPFLLTKLEKYWSFLISGPQHAGVVQKQTNKTR